MYNLGRENNLKIYILDTAGKLSDSDPNDILLQDKVHMYPRRHCIRKLGTVMTLLVLVHYDYSVEELMMLQIPPQMKSAQLRLAFTISIRFLRSSASSLAVDGKHYDFPRLVSGSIMAFNSYFII